MELTFAWTGQTVSKYRNPIILQSCYEGKNMGIRKSKWLSNSVWGPNLDKASPWRGDF